jgi:dynein heavy chain
MCRSANCLLKRLEQSHTALMAVKHMLPAVPEAADTLMAHDLTHQALQQFIVNTHTEWFNTIDNSISKQLQNSLLSQDKANGGSCPRRTVFL